jgi:hypothetical protein
VDLLADYDGSLLPVLAEARVQRGEIQTLVQTDLRTSQAVPRRVDFLTPLTVGLCCCRQLAGSR